MRLPAIILICVATLLGGGTQAAEWQMFDSPKVLLATIPAEHGAAADTNFRIGCIADNGIKMLKNVALSDGEDGISGPRARLVVRGRSAAGSFAFIGRFPGLGDGNTLLFSLPDDQLAKLLSRMPFVDEIEVGIFPAANYSVPLDTVRLANAQIIPVDRSALEKIIARCPPINASPSRTVDEIIKGLGVPDGQWSFSDSLGFPVAFIQFDGRLLFMSCKGSALQLSVPAADLKDTWTNVTVSLAFDPAGSGKGGAIDGVERLDEADRAIFNAQVRQEWLDHARAAKQVLIVGIVANLDETYWTEFPVRGSTAAIEALQRACAA